MGRGVGDSAGARAGGGLVNVEADGGGGESRVEPAQGCGSGLSVGTGLDHADAVGPFPAGPGQLGVQVVAQPWVGAGHAPHRGDGQGGLFGWPVDADVGGADVVGGLFEEHHGELTPVFGDFDDVQAVVVACPDFAAAVGAGRDCVVRGRGGHVGAVTATVVLAGSPVALTR